MDFTVQTTVNAPAARVWAILCDVERWPEWTPTVTRVERLDTGPLRVGSRARVQQPKLADATWTVTTLDAAKGVFTWTSTPPGVRSVADHRVTDGPGDAVTVTLGLRMSGWLAPVIGLVYGGLARRYVQTEAQTLKRRAETPSVIAEQSRARGA